MSTLRSRRRQEMLDEIRQAAVRIAADRGYENLTAPLIAEAAGISLRTFFNYYPNKDAALIGPQNTATAELADSLRLSTEPLLDALEAFVMGQLKAANAQRRLLKELMKVTRDIPHLNSALANRGNDIRTALIQALQVRLPDAAACDHIFLADLTVSTLRQAFEAWVHSDALTTQDATAAAFVDLRRFLATVIPALDPPR